MKYLQKFESFLGGKPRKTKEPKVEAGWKLYGNRLFGDGDVIKVEDDEKHGKKVYVDFGGDTGKKWLVARFAGKFKKK